MVELLPITNCLLSLGVLWASICRLNHGRTKKNYQLRLKYSLFTTLAVLSLFQGPFFGASPSFLSVAGLAAIFIGQMLGIQHWLHKEEEGNAEASSHNEDRDQSSSGVAAVKARLQGDSRHASGDGSAGVSI